MPFVPFHDFDPELAERETRSITLPEPSGGLPAGDYGMLEMYCDDKGCDCRRVLFLVVSSQFRKPLAVVNYGWESLEFYANWGPFDRSKEMALELKGPNLNIGSPQSPLAPSVLELIEDVLLPDPAYIQRLQRHYHMVRQVVDHKTTRQNLRLDPRSRKQLRIKKLRELRKKAVNRRASPLVERRTAVASPESLP